MRPFRSLQARLLALLLGLLAAVWLATAALTWSDVHHELDEMFDAHLAQAAGLLVTQAHDADDDDTVNLPTLHRYAPRVAFQIWSDGVLWLRSAQAPQEPLGGPHFVPGFSDQAFGGRHWRVFSTEGAVAGVRVYVAEQDESRQDILWALLRGMLWPVAPALSLLVGSLWWAVRRSLAPLCDMGAAIAARDPSSLQPVALPDTGVCLRVDDSGPGLDAVQRARLGERFFRVLGGGASGSGLGWSIVRRIAAAHGAQVQVGRSETRRGLSVRVDWPMTTQAAA